MKIINKSLSEKNLTIETLPSNLLQEVNSFKQMIEKYNEACEEYEKQPDVNKEIEKKLDEQEATLETTENAIAEKIKAYEPPVEPKTEPPVEPKTEPKTEPKGDGVGFLIFAAVAAVLTLGAVNFLKKN